MIVVPLPRKCCKVAHSRRLLHDLPAEILTRKLMRLPTEPPLAELLYSMKSVKE